MKDFETIKKRLFDVRPFSEICPITPKDQVGIGGKVIHPETKKHLMVVATIDGGYTEHVSVSTNNRTPTWEEMCFVKDICFEEEEVTIQFHPKKSEYVNTHENCLHMWRPVKGKEDQFIINWD